MNTVLSLRGLPASLVHTSNPSVPNHSAAPATSFALVHSWSLFVAAYRLTEPLWDGPRLVASVGLGAGFAQRSQARRSAQPNRVYFVSCLSCHVITDGLFTSGSSP